jgi:hypothetical protein
MGWYMVKSGLHEDTMPTEGVPRVSPYRLGPLSAFYLIDYPLLAA